MGKPDRRIPLKDGWEYDAFTGWRKLYNWKAGVIKQIKRRYNKRKRRIEKERLRTHSKTTKDDA